MAVVRRPGRLLRRWILWRYRKRLGPALFQRYGAANGYTVAQVRTTFDVLGLDPRCEAYALAGYCDRATFEREVGGDWASLRATMKPVYPFPTTPSEPFYESGIGMHGGGGSGSP
jgi:hypothetical protein